MTTTRTTVQTRRPVITIGVKHQSRSTRGPRISGIALPGTLLVAALAGTICNTALGQVTGPVDPRVMAGTAGFSRQGNNFTITTSRMAVINYTSFNVGRDDTVRFIQPDAQSRVLNRITNMMPTTIEGRVTANGQVYWINPAGVTFGATSVINVGQFFAAAGAISDPDFLAGVNRFTNLTGKVQNYGSITAGSVNLVGTAVANYGTIQGLENSVLLAAGSDVLVQQRGDSNLLVRVAGGSNSGGVVNNGTVTGRRRVAFASGDVASMAINNQGRVAAPTVTMDAPSGNVLVGGQIDTSNRSGRGGTVDITGSRIAVDQARIDASGSTGGGQINIGGNQQGREGPLQNSETVYVSNGSSLTANATTAGDGGRVVVWSEQVTNFQGSASANGAGANGSGGFIETSSRGSLSVASQGISAAASGTGQAGLWLLDPSDVTIQNGGATVGPPPDLFNPLGASGVVTDTDILNALATTNVTVSTAAGTGGAGTITVAASTNLVYASATTRTLTLDADAGISVASGAVLSSTSGRLNVVLDAGGAVAVNGAITTNGGDFTVSQTSTSFTLGVTGSVNASRTGADGGLVSIRPTGNVIISGPITTTGLTAGGGDAALPVIQISGNSLTINSTGGLTSGSGTRNGAISAIVTGAIDIQGPVVSNTVGNGSFIRLQAGDTVSQSGIGLITGGALAVQAGNGINLDLANLLRQNTDTAATPGLFSLSSTAGGITFRNGFGINITPIAALAFTGDAGTSITQTAGVTATAAAANVAITSTTGAINLVGTGTAAPITTGTGAVTLTAFGSSNIAFSQNASASITTTNLTLNYFAGGAGAALLDRSDNAVGRLDVNMSTGGANAFVRLRNDAALVLGGISLPSPAHTAGTDVTGNFLSLLSNGNVTQAGGTGITARGVALRGTGNFTLTSTTNNVSVLSASGPTALLYRDSAGGLEVGSIDSTTGGAFGTASNIVGLTMTGNNPEIRVDAGGLTFTQAVTADTLRLTTVGGITQGASGALNLTSLAVVNSDDAGASTGAVVLTNAANNVGTLAALQSDASVGAATTAFTYTAANAISIGSVAGTATFNGNAALAGVQSDSTASATQINTGGLLTITETISSPGQMTLNSGAGVTATGAAGLVDGTGGTGSLLLLGTGVFNLDNAAGPNSVDFLAGNVAGSILFNSGVSYTIGTVGATNGLSVGTGAGRIITLRSGGTLSQTQAITANGLQLLGSSDASLSTVNNNVLTLAANLTTNGSTLNFRDDTGFAIGTVNDTINAATSGLNVTSAANSRIRLQTNSGTINQDVNANNAGGSITAVNLELASSGGTGGQFVLLHESNSFSTLSGAVSGSGTPLVRVTESNGFAFGGPVVTTMSVGTGVLAVSAGGAVTQAAGGAVTAGTLVLSGAGPYTLNTEANAVTTLASNATDALLFRNGSALTIGSGPGVAGSLATGTTVTGLSMAGLSPEIQVDAGGLAITQAVNTGTLRVTSTGGVTQSGLGVITATNLAIINNNDANAATGAVTLSLSNAVATIAINQLDTGVTGGTDVLTYTAGGAVTVGSVAGTATFNGNAALNGVSSANTVEGLRINSTGLLTISQAINSDASKTLNSAAGVATSGANGIVTGTGAGNTLLLLGTGVFDLQNAAGANAVSTLAGNVAGSVLFRSSTSYSIGTVAGTTGLSVGTGAGRIVTLDQDAGAVSQAQAITANGLQLLGSGTGVFNLTGANNDVTTLAGIGASGQAMRFRDDNGFAIGTVNDTVNAATSGLDAGVGVGSTIELQSANGTVNQDVEATNAGGRIQTLNLELTSSGGTGAQFNLLNENNAIGTLSGSVAGANAGVRLTDAGGLVLGGPSVNGITVGSAGGITSTLALSNDGAITQAGSSVISAERLVLTGAGSATLNESTNLISALAANLTGDLNIRTTGPLVIDQGPGVPGTLATGTTVSGVTVGATPDGTVGNGGIFTLQVDGGAISQLAAAPIVVDTLRITSVAAVNLLTSTTNNADAVEGSVTGAGLRFRFRDSNGLTVGGAGGLDGITTNDGDIDLFTGGTLAVTEALNADGTPGGGRGSVSLTSTGGATQSGTGVITGNRLLLTGSGAFTLDTLNNDVIILTAATLSGGSATSIRLRSDTALTTVEAIGNLVGQDRPGLLALTTDGTVSQAVGTTTDVQNLVLRGSGNFTLRAGAVFSTSPNGNTNVAANLGGATSFINLTNLGGMTVGTVDGVSGITLPTLAVNVVRFENATGTQVVPSTITQMLAAGNQITAGGLILAGNGAITLGNTANSVGVFAGAMSAGSSASLSHTGSLIIGTVANDPGLPVGKQFTATGFTGASLTLLNAGDIAFNEAINLGATGGTFRFEAANVTQGATGGITANAIGGVATGSITLDQANDINTVALTTLPGTGDITFNSNNGYQVGTVAAQTGWNGGAALIGVSATRGATSASGDGAVVTLSGDGVIGQTADAAGVATGNVQGDTIRISGAGSGSLSTSLFNDADAVEGSLTTAGAVFSFRDANSFEVGAAGGLAGITTNDGDIQLFGVSNTGGTPAITLTEAVNADGTPGGARGNVTLTATGTEGGASQSGTGIITADQLNLAGNGAFVLDTLDNGVLVLSAPALSGGSATSVRLRSDTDLTTVANIGNLAGQDRVGLLALTSNNAVSQGVGTTIDAQNLALRGTGGYTLTVGAVSSTTPNGDVNLAANLTGATSYIDLTNTGSLVVGTADGLNGVSVGNLAVNIVRFANATGAQVTPSTVTQGSAANQAIAAGGLILSGNGTINLSNTSNAVGVLAGDMAQTAGVAAFVANSAALSIGTVANDASLPVGKQVSVTGFTGTDLTIVNTGAVSIDQAVNLGATGGTLRVQSTADVSQAVAGTITANFIGVVSAGMILDSANDVNNVALNSTGGDIVFRGNSGYTVATVPSDPVFTGASGWNSGNALIGINTASTVQLRGDSTIGQTADAAGVATGSITANRLLIESVGGAVSLATSSFNDVAELEAEITGAGAALAYADRNNLQIGTPGAGTGILTSDGDVSITTGVFATPRTDAPVVSGRLTVTEAIAAGTGTVTIDSTNGATQSGTGTITASSLAMLGQGGFDLDNLNNNAATIAGLVTGATSAIAFRDDNGFEIGTVGPTLGINIGTATTNSLVLESTGSVTQSQALVAGQLGLRGAGPGYVLTNTGNSFAVLGASTTGASGITVRNSVATQINTVTSTDATTIDGVNTGAATGVVAILSNSAVTQAAGAAGRITTDQLVLIGSGPFTLENVTNDVNRLASGPSNTGDTPAPSRLTSGASSLSFVNANGFAIDSIDPAGATVGAVAGLSTTGGITLRAANGDAMVLRRDVVSSGSAPVVFSGPIQLDAPAPNRTVTVDSGTGIVRFYGSINGAAGTDNLQNLVIRSDAVPTVELAPIGFGGSIGNTVPLRSADIGGNAGAFIPDGDTLLGNKGGGTGGGQTITPATSTIVWATNWIQTAGPNQHRVSSTPGVGPFSVTAQQSIRFGDRQKVLSFGNLTLTSRGANGTTSATDTGLDRGLIRFTDVSAVGDFNVDADRIELVLRPIAGAGSPSRPFGRNFDGGDRERFAENGTGPDGPFHPAIDGNGTDVVANAIDFAVEPTLIFNGTPVTRNVARGAGVATNSIFSVSNPGGTDVPGYNGPLDIRRRVNAITVAGNFLPSVGGPPATTPVLDLIATGEQGTLEVRNPLIVPNLPEVDQGVRLDRANREFLSRLQVPVSSDEDPSEALDRLVGRSFYNDATGRTAQPSNDESAFLARLREEHSISLGRINNAATTRVREAYAVLFGEQADGTRPTTRIRDLFGESYNRWVASNGGAPGTMPEFGAYLQASEAETYGYLVQLREFFGLIDLLGLTSGENAVPRDRLLEDVRPEAISSADFRELVVGKRAEVVTPTQARKAVVAIEQRFNDTFLVPTAMVDENGAVIPGGGTYPRFNAMKASFGAALKGFAAAQGGTGDAAAFTAYVQASDPAAAGYLAEVRSFFGDLNNLGMPPAALEDTRSKTLEMLRPSNIAPDLFRQLVLGAGA